MNKPTFTVLTGCYNSSRFIHRIFESLKKQTFKDFEWFVVNDASTDNTSELIKEYIKTVDFPVIFTDLKINQGMKSHINRAIREGRGKYYVSCGHDDALSHDALETFYKTFQKFDSPKISTVYGLLEDETGKLIGRKVEKNELVSNYWVEFYDKKNERDKIGCHKIEKLREVYPFPLEKNKEQSSSWLWGRLATKYDSVYVNKVLRTRYTEPTSVTNTSKRDTKPLTIFNYHVVWTNEFQYYIKNKKRRLRGIGACVSHGLLAGLSLRQILSHIDKKRNKVLCILFYPVALFYNYKNPK